MQEQSPTPRCASQTRVLVISVGGSLGFSTVVVEFAGGPLYPKGCSSFGKSDGFAGLQPARLRSTFYRPPQALDRLRLRGETVLCAPT